MWHALAVGLVPSHVARKIQFSRRKTHFIDVVVNYTDADEAEDADIDSYD